MDMNKAFPIAICWFRRDLRLYDHATLYHALKNSTAVHCVFGTDNLGTLLDKADRRMEFIWRSVVGLQHDGFPPQPRQHPTGVARQFAKTYPCKWQGSLTRERGIIGKDYAVPVVDYALARVKVLEMFKQPP